MLMRDCGQTTMAWKVPCAVHVKHFAETQLCTGAQQAALGSLPLHVRLHQVQIAVHNTAVRKSCRCNERYVGAGCAQCSHLQGRR